MELDSNEYRDILFSMSDAVFLTDRDGNFKWICPNVHFIFGFDEKETEQLGNIEKLIGASYKKYISKSPSGDELLKNHKQKITDKDGIEHHLLINIKETTILGADHLITCRDVTDTINSEQEKSQLNQELKALLDTIPDLIWMKDLEGKFLGCNKEFEKVIGAKEEEIVGKYDSDFISEDMALFFEKHDSMALESGRPHTLEYRERRGNKEVTVETTKTPMYDDNGNAIAVIGVARDVTAKKKAEEELESKNEILLLSQKMAKLGSWRLDVIQNDLSWSDEIFRIFDEEPQSFEGTVEAFYSFVHPDEVDHVQAYFNECVTKKKPYHITHRIITKAGEVKYVEENATFEFDEDNGLIIATGTVQDVTQTELYQKELKTRDNNLKKFFENVPVGITKASLEYGLMDANPEFEKLTGYSFEELQGLDYWDITPKKYEGLEMEILQEMSKTGRYGPYQKEYIDKNGTKVPVLLSGVQISDNEGNDFIWSVIQDISVEEKIKNELNQDIEKFKVLLDTAKLISFDVDLESGELRTIRERKNIDSTSYPFSDVYDLKTFFNQIRKEHQSIFQKKINEIKSGTSNHVSCEFQIRKGDQFFWYEAIMSVLDKNEEDEVKAAFIILKNIGEEKKQEILRLRSQEKERLRIARDIHDSIGQMLVGTRLTLKNQMRHLEGLEEIDQLLDEMIKECRMIINNFGISLENANFKKTFISLAEKMGKVYSGNINVDWSGDEFVDNLKLATNIFRIYQEALSNAIKYSGSKRIDVFIENDGNIYLEVKDEGGGFDITKTGEGFGLTNMSERANEIGYLFEVISSIDKGTRILLRPDI